MKNRILTVAIISALATGCAMDTSNHTTHLEPITDAMPSLRTGEQELADLRKDLTGTGIQAFSFGPVTSLIMPRTITFAKGGHDVDQKYFTALTNVANALNKHKTAKIRINGYAGSNEGSPEKILTISEARANAVANILVSSNVDISRIEVKGLGDQYPANEKKRKVSRQDRRVFIAMVNDNG